MKLTIILLTAAFLQVSARGHSQTVTYSGKNVPLENIFAEIKRQTGILFFYSSEDIALSKPVTVSIKNASVEEALKQVMTGQPLKYDIKGNTIFISKATAATPEKKEEENLPPPINVRGRIVNEEGEPVAGASIAVRNDKTKGATTNSNGEFTLNDVDANAELIITGVNIEPIFIKLEGRTELKLIAKIRVNVGEEVIVNKGYYSERQKTMVGNVGRITAKEIEKQPVMNALLAASGRIPGLNITQQNGTPGAGIKVQIRGTNSIASGNNPLLVIDGMPMSMSITPGAGNLVTVNVFGSQTPPPGILNYINPADIESIEVLKDADATSIYGSRGANGVLLITTKKGKVGKSTVNISVNRGVGKVGHFMHLMNKEEYTRYRNMTFAMSGGLPSSTDYDMNGTWGNAPYKDWQKLLIGGSAQYFDAQASVSGGTPLTQYFISGGIHRETTVYPGDYYNMRPSMHFSLTNISTNKKLRMMFSATYASDRSFYPSSDMVNNLFYYPNAPEIHHEDGTLNWQNNTFANPFNTFEVRSKINSSNLISGAELNYEIFTGLNLKVIAGYSHSQIDDIYAEPSTFLYTLTDGRSQFSFNNSSSWNVEPQVSYERRVGKGKLNLLAGTTFIENINNNNAIAATGYTDNNLLESLAAAGAVSRKSSNYTQYRSSSGYARINYNLDDRYVMNLTGRVDGSSRFGPGKRIANFGSAGVGWIFSNESFFKKEISFISFGKLRATYGTSGNDQIQDYLYYDLYQFTNFNPGYQGSQGLYPGNLFNPDLAWEINKKAEVAIDLGLWRDRINLSASFYRNRSGNQLVKHSVPGITGFTTTTDNIPALVQNKGWEFLVSSTNFKNRNFSWQSSFNLSLEQNKLVSFPGIEKTVYINGYIVGQPITGAKYYVCLGLDPVLGVYTFMDKNGNPTLTPDNPTDKIKYISTAPKYYGGLQNSFTYKNFSLDISLVFKKQNGNNLVFQGTVQPGYFNNNNGRNWLVDVLKAWQKPGDATLIQRLSNKVGDAAYNAYSYVRTSDYAMTDASFLRIQNVMLSWQLPQGVKDKLHLRSSKLYLQVQNLYTFTRYKGLDPENGGLYMPPLRMIVAGLQVIL